MDCNERFRVFTGRMSVCKLLELPRQRVNLTRARKPVESPIWLVWRLSLGLTELYDSALPFSGTLAPGSESPRSKATFQVQAFVYHSLPSRKSWATPLPRSSFYFFWKLIPSLKITFLPKPFPSHCQRWYRSISVLKIFDIPLRLNPVVKDLPR